MNKTTILQSIIRGKDVAVKGIKDFGDLSKNVGAKAGKGIKDVGIMSKKGFVDLFKKK